jgi:hypothetical protein
MAKYKLRLDIETDPPSRSSRSITWSWLVAGFLTSLLAGLVLALLL